MQGSRSTIHDVAARAKVSLQTVSNVINHPEIVRPETAERVRAAIAALEFRVDHRARSLRYGTSRTLACVTTDAEDPSFFAKSYFSRVLRGVIVGAEGHSYQPLIHMVRGNTPASLKQLFDEGRVDGAVVAAAVAPPRLIDQIRDWNLPVVFLDRNVPGAPSVSAAYARPMTELVRLLVLGGSRRLAFVGGHLRGAASSTTSAARLAGFMRGVREARLEVDDAFIVEASWSIEAGQAAFEQLQRGRKRPDAIVAASDGLAVGILRGAAAHGLKVPKDLRVTGFDDDILASAVTPALTTARLDLEGMAAQATRMLFDHIRGELPPEKWNVEFAVDIVRRESA